MAQSYSFSAVVHLNSRTQVRDKILPAGQYKVVFEGNRPGSNQCAFVSTVKDEPGAINGSAGKLERAGNIVAEVPCTLKARQNPAKEDSVVFNQDRLTEIYVKGKSEALDFTF